jgi:hypothetical protein
MKKKCKNCKWFKDKNCMHKKNYRLSPYWHDGWGIEILQNYKKKNKDNNCKNFKIK